jgi:hypothetical protein
MDPQKLAKWKKWIGDGSTEGSISRELMILALNRQVFAGVKQIVDANSEIQVHSSFYQVFTSNHAHSALMYIRRQVDRHPDSVSLMNFPLDLRGNHELITQNYYVSLYTQDAVDEVDLENRTRWGESDFEEYFGSPIEGHINPGIFDADIKSLDSVSTNIKSFVDQRLAHLDKHKPDRVPKLDELESACDTLGNILKKYILLLDAKDYQIAPVLQHDWKAIFRVPWLRDDI